MGIPWTRQPPAGTPLAGLVRAVKSYDGLWLPGQSSRNLLIGSASSYSATPQRQIVGGQWGLNTAGSNGYVIGANQDAIAYTGLTYIATFRPISASVTSKQSTILRSSSRAALYWDQQTSAYQQTLFIIDSGSTAFPLSYGSPAVGVWTTIVAVADLKGNAWIYRDGKLVASSSSYATSCTSAGSGTPVTLGNDGSNFPGEIALGASLGYAIPLPLALALSANPWQLFKPQRRPFYSLPSAGPPTITISPSSLPDAACGVVYNATLSASGGVAPYTFAVVSGPSSWPVVPAGSPPPAGPQPWFWIRSDNVLAGIPMTTGTFPLTISATDSVGNVGTRAYSLNINPGPPYKPWLGSDCLCRVASAQGTGQGRAPCTC